MSLSPLPFSSTLSRNLEQGHPSEIGFLGSSHRREASTYGQEAHFDEAKRRSRETRAETQVTNTSHQFSGLPDPEACACKEYGHMMAWRADHR